MHEGSDFFGVGDIGLPSFIFGRLLVRVPSLLIPDIVAYRFPGESHNVVEMKLLIYVYVYVLSIASYDECIGAVYAIVLSSQNFHANYIMYLSVT